jgi:GNAT superfamily N-acetyltransferase
MLTFTDITAAHRELILPMVADFYRTDAVEHEVPVEIMERSFAAAADPDEPLLRGVLVEEDGVPAGYVYLTFCYSAEVGGRCVFIEEIFLKEDFRGRGLGREIMAWMEREYPQVRRFRLEVTQVNKQAIRLYEGSGYRYLRYDQMVFDK